MALFHTTVLDNQIKALPTVDTASGAIATFDTDLTENLVSVKCQIVAQQASGTPSPDNPLPITTYTEMNVSHSGSDTSNPNVTNIPFGQTVANGVLDITTGKLRVTHKIVTLDSSVAWSKNSQTKSNAFVSYYQFPNYYRANGLCSHFSVAGSSDDTEGIYFGGNINILTPLSLGLDTVQDFKDWIDAQAQNGTPVQVVYKLATPIEIQLDSITLQALLNENNIWCDTGDTEVKFLLTVGKKIG